MRTPPWFRSAVSLAPRTTLQVGGPARWFAECTHPAQVAEALSWADDRGVPVQVLGGGSNTLVADAGFDGLVLAPALRGVEAVPSGEGVEVTAAAGEIWDAFVAHAVTRGWAGLTCLSGIPGWVGAAPIQNVGAYGQEVADTLVRVRVWDRVARAPQTLTAAECGFGYRHSRFKADATGRFVVLSATFALTPGGAPSLRYPELRRRLADASTSLAAVRDAVLALRRGKSMVYDPADPNHRSAGSFFVNPHIAADALPGVLARVARSGLDPSAMPRWPQPDGTVKLSAAWLIQRAGLDKGVGAGRVGLSSKHTLGLINRGGATAEAVWRFAGEVQATVARAFGVRLVPEPVRVGFSAAGGGPPAGTSPRTPQPSGPS